MKFLAAAAIGFLCLLVLTGVAGATGGGGGTIATAPVAPVGSLQFGSTASFTDSCQNGFEYWTLNLAKGDLVKITWGAPPAADTLALFPSGTTDSANNGCLYSSGFSAWTTQPILTDSNAVAAQGHSAQTVVNADGSYPLLFLDTTGTSNAGSYSFTAVVEHGASIALPPNSSIPGKGQLTSAVLTPDGAPIDDPSLKLTLNGYWRNAPGKPATAHKLAVTTAPVNGVATFDYTVPSSEWGQRISWQISGSGTNYQPVASVNKPVKVLVPNGVPGLLSPAQLKSESKTLRRPIYWAGPRKGFHYEFMDTTIGYSFVRYLPHGVPAGSRSPFLTVATYPLKGAYNHLKKYSKNKAVAGPHGSIYFADPAHPTSVYVAFPKINFEIEIFDPKPAVARAIAAGGLVQPVK